jgi:hypothetical protein
VMSLQNFLVTSSTGRTDVLEEVSSALNGAKWTKRNRSWIVGFEIDQQLRNDSTGCCLW